jgi:hypothetical protein
VNYKDFRIRNGFFQSCSYPKILVVLRNGSLKASTTDVSDMGSLDVCLFVSPDSYAHGVFV